MVVHCLFEQSGTFKNEFKKLGFDAYDYDIENKFGETDFQIDLFAEIEKCVEREHSAFDSFSQNDLIIAFFPCIRFTDMCLLLTTCNNMSTNNWALDKKLKYSMKISKEQANLYKLFCYLFLICIERNLKLIVENPYSSRHYVTMNFPIQATIIDNDRRLLGDDFQKPTQYWFVNLSPKYNTIDYKPPFIFGNRVVKPTKIVTKTHGIDRSLINPKYAENFIRKYIL